MPGAFTPYLGDSLYTWGIHPWDIHPMPGAVTPCLGDLPLGHSFHAWGIQPIPGGFTHGRVTPYLGGFTPCLEHLPLGNSAFTWGIHSMPGAHSLGEFPLCLGSHPRWGLTTPCPAGRDATRAFASGDFTPAGLVDTVSGLSPAELLSIHRWLSFYSDNYEPVGRCQLGVGSCTT